jgi:glycerol-3-phosphate dehydrogenase (NAD(P)+)
VLAEHSRNRRAGELLADGVHPGEIQELLGQVPEALTVVPVLRHAMHEAGIPCPATDQLAALVEGELAADSWLESTQRPKLRTRAA